MNSISGDPLGLADRQHDTSSVPDVFPNFGSGSVQRTDLEIPGWFGLELDGYQVEGAERVAAGFTLLADEPGLGKTRQALAAAAIVGAKRIVVVCPPVVVTAWQRESTASGIGDSGVCGPDRVVTFRSGLKEPTLPDTHGVVVVPDTLLAARPALVSKLCGWCPDVVIVDEVHREKTWTSKRSKAVRLLAASASMLSVGVSGTPMFASPVELASPLAICGKLDSVFGGWSKFVHKFARQNRWHQWVPRKRMLGELKGQLDNEVWVRRTKAEALPDLPKKAPRRVLWVDVPPGGYRKANADVTATIDKWVKGLPQKPSVVEVDEWCLNAGVGLITSLRRAAGLAKVESAVEMISDWVEATTSIDDNGVHVFSRPLVVWTHHREVSEAMALAVPKRIGSARSIIGGVPHDERSRIIDDFQAGLIPVLVCSIHAAGVGITLTRSSDAWFIETDWTPAVVSQAEDRIARRGQTRQPILTTLIAPGTLDERIQKVLSRKIKILDEVLTGADHNVTVLADLDDLATPADLIRDLVWVSVSRRWK